MRGLIPASVIINAICKKLDYSRAHVAKVMRDNARFLKAKQENSRWFLPAEAGARLEQIVKDTSGRRYKLGEKGPHA